MLSCLDYHSFHMEKKYERYGISRPRCSNFVSFVCFLFLGTASVCPFKYRQYYHGSIGLFYKASSYWNWSAVTHHDITICIPFVHLIFLNVDNIYGDYFGVLLDAAACHGLGNDELPCGQKNDLYIHTIPVNKTRQQILCDNENHNMLIIHWIG